MKPTSISAEALFEAHREAMRWEWVAGHAHPERHFADEAVREARSAVDLIGYLNYLHPYRVQIVGRREVPYLGEGEPEDIERRISRIVTLEPLLDDQELDARASTGGHYWEGAVRVLEAGKPAGRGYLELTGYAAPLRL
jgi:hypothetical protein